MPNLPVSTYFISVSVERVVTIHSYDHLALAHRHNDLSDLGGLGVRKPHSSTRCAPEGSMRCTRGTEWQKQKSGSMHHEWSGCI